MNDPLALIDLIKSATVQSRQMAYWKPFEDLIIEEKYDQTIEEIMNERKHHPHQKAMNLCGEIARACSNIGYDEALALLIARHNMTFKEAMRGQRCSLEVYNMAYVQSKKISV